MIDLKVCSRCGDNKKIERHHIKHRVNGGSNGPENLKDLCLACHDYQHAKEDIDAHIQKTERKRQFTRLKIWQYRLYVLEQLNKPAIIKSLGYRSYWMDTKTHYMSREVRAFVPPKEQAELSLESR